MVILPKLLSYPLLPSTHLNTEKKAIQTEKKAILFFMWRQQNWFAGILSRRQSPVLFECLPRVRNLAIETHACPFPGVGRPHQPGAQQMSNCGANECRARDPPVAGMLGKTLSILPGSGQVSKILSGNRNFSFRIFLLDPREGVGLSREQKQIPGCLLLQPPAPHPCQSFGNSRSWGEVSVGFRWHK